MNFQKAIIFDLYINNKNLYEFPLDYEKHITSAFNEDEIAEKLLGEEFCKQFEWSEASPNDKLEVLFTVRDLINGEKYYGVYPYSKNDDKIIGNNITTFPTITCETEREAIDFLWKMYETDLNLIEVPKQDIYYTVGAKSPTHVANNEIRKEFINKLSNFSKLNIEDKQQLMSFCFDEFCRYQMSPLQKRDILWEWKKHQDWKETVKNHSNYDTAKYTPISEEEILNNFEDLKKDIEDLEYKYKIFRTQFENSYLNKEKVHEGTLKEIKSKSTSLYLEILEKKKEANILLHTLHSYISFTGKINDVEYGQTNDYIEKYNNMAELTKRLNNLNPEYFVIGNRGIEFAEWDKEIKKDHFKAFKDELSNLLDVHYLDDEKANIILKAKNELKDKYNNTLKSHNVYNRRLEVEKAGSRADTLNWQLFKKFPSEFHDVYDFFNRQNPKIDEIIESFDKSDFHKIFEIDKDEFHKYCELREEYSKLFQESSTKTTYFDEINKNVIVASLCPDGYEVKRYDMPAYLNELAKNTGETGYKFGTTQTFTFDFEGKLINVEKIKFENGFENTLDFSTEEVKKELNLEVLRAERYEEVDIEKLNFKMGMILNILKADYEHSKENPEKDKVKANGYVKSELGFSVGTETKIVAKFQAQIEAWKERMDLIIHKIKASITHDVVKNATEASFQNINSNGNGTETTIKIFDPEKSLESAKPSELINVKAIQNYTNVETTQGKKVAEVKEKNNSRFEKIMGKLLEYKEKMQNKPKKDSR